jgi:outer membrane immunogenic protein
MRSLVCGLLLASVASPVLAGDLDSSWLRGSSRFPADPPSYQRWSGFYAGGQIAEDFRGVDFRNVVGDSLGHISGLDGNFQGIPLSSFPQLSSLNTKAPSFGGFIGYNYQIDDIVMGAGLNVSKSSLQASITDSETHAYYVPANGNLYATPFNVVTKASASVAEYVTARARLGWAYGSFLPYVFGGIAMSQINTTRSVNVNYLGTITGGGTPTTIGGNYTQGTTTNGEWNLGFDVGLGVDYALTRNIFLRGELEYIQFGTPNQIKINDASARAGAGLRF